MADLTVPTDAMPADGYDEARLRALYKEWGSFILAYAMRRTAARSDAEEILADTFATAWRRLSSVPEGNAALPWLYAVAGRVLANHRRSDRRRVRLLDRLRAQELAGGRAPASLSSTIAERLELAFDGLREEDQEVLRLAAWEELRPAEIAEVLGISANAASVRLHRARRALREAFAAFEACAAGGHGEGETP